MAYFRPRLQIFSLLSSSNKYNPFFWQQSWHYAKSVRLTKNINEDCNARSISTIPKRSERYGLKKKELSSSLRRSSSTKKKLAAQKLTLWEYVFGPKRSSKNPSTCQLADRQEQTQCEEDSRYQTTSRDVLVYTDLVKSSKKSKRRLEPQPKPPPSYKLPRAVLLSRTMVQGFAKKDGTYEEKMVIPTMSRKTYEEMKPASNIKASNKGIRKNRENVGSEDVKQYEKSTSRRVLTPTNTARDATAKILHKAMVRQEPRIHSRIEQLKILMNKKMTETQGASRINSDHKNSDE